MDCPVLQHVPLCEPVAAERKYDWGGLAREAVKQTIRRLSARNVACEGQELGG